jgi:hypothetical protein
MLSLGIDRFDHLLTATGSRRTMWHPERVHGDVVAAAEVIHSSAART